MADLDSLIQEVRYGARPEWTPEREDRVRAGISRALAWQRRRRIAYGVFASTLMIAFGAFLALRSPSAVTPPPVATVAEPQPQLPAALLRFADGSEVTARSEDARIETMPSPLEGVVLRLRTGAARFSVAPQRGHEFRVLAGDVTVTVIGTVFTVAMEEEAVRVVVEHGKVHVSGPSGERELGTGEEGEFPELRILPESDAPEPAPEVSASPARRAARASWRALAEDGNYAAAIERLRKEGPAAVRDRPEDLLLAADAARLGGSPAEAVAPLERLLARYSFDARAPLAAFTLGRTLLDQLGRPREAAQSFATARRLDASGALAQDALAREVESWSRAGESELARARAKQYLARYPDGRRAAAVRRLGGIE